jgi:digeranylgeranylglycerophospholipid reductase
MESAIQYSVSNIDIKRNNMIMYVGEKYAPGGYLWIFPKGNRFANVGLGISGKYSKHKSAKNYLDEFMKKKFPNASILTTMCGGVPCARPMKNPINNGLMLAGDAAHQINPLTGGGITSGMKGGSIAGKVAADAIKIGDYSKDFLKNYSSLMWNSFGKND